MHGPKQVRPAIEEVDAWRRLNRRITTSSNGRTLEYSANTSNYSARTYLLIPFIFFTPIWEPYHLCIPLIYHIILSELNGNLHLPPGSKPLSQGKVHVNILAF